VAPAARLVSASQSFDLHSFFCDFVDKPAKKLLDNYKKVCG
jgi:hypothetical protein